MATWRPWTWGVLSEGTGYDESCCVTEINLELHKKPRLDKTRTLLQNPIVCIVSDDGDTKSAYHIPGFIIKKHASS